MVAAKWTTKKSTVPKKKMKRTLPASRSNLLRKYKTPSEGFFYALNRPGAIHSGGCEFVLCLQYSSVWQFRLGEQSGHDGKASSTTHDRVCLWLIFNVNLICFRQVSRFIPHHGWTSNFSFDAQPTRDAREDWPHRPIGTTLPDVELNACFAARQSC